MSKGIDFIDWQRNNLGKDELKKEFGLSDEQVDQLSRVEILTFYRSEKDDKQVMAKLDSGGVVFRHHHGGEMIQPGETWIVELEKKKTTFFAKGLKKLDSQFFFDLRVDQVDLIADAIWKNYRTIIEPLLEERYQESLRHVLETEIRSEASKEMDKYQQEIKDLEKELQKQKDEFKQVKNKLNKEKKKKKTKSTKEEKSTAKESVIPDSMIPLKQMVQQPVIRRIGPDVLESPQFTEDHYFVHISSDQSIMTITPHGRGTVLCVDNQLHLQGLGLISEFGGPYDMPVEYSPKYGGFLVFLKYAATSMRTSK